jgi:hypothetical protein
MHAKIGRLSKTIDNAICGMNSEALNWHPTGKWSAAEILDHLNLTYLGTIKNMERRLAEGRPPAAEGRAGKTLARIAVTKFGYFPPGRKSPERVLPCGTPVQQVLSEIQGNLARMDDLLSQCESRFPKGSVIAQHPALGPLTAAEWRGFHLTHGCHHMKQIRALRQQRLFQG